MRYRRVRRLAANGWSLCCQRCSFGAWWAHGEPRRFAKRLGNLLGEHGPTPPLCGCSQPSSTTNVGGVGIIWDEYAAPFYCFGLNARLYQHCTLVDLRLDLTGLGLQARDFLVGRFHHAAPLDILTLSQNFRLMTLGTLISKTKRKSSQKGM